jgi:glycosyltransferase involved in cell wall biosynthesis
MNPDITILAPDLRSPSIGAAIRLRELLQPYSVEIVGPDFDGGVCSMYRESGPFVVVPTKKLYRWPEFFWESRKLDRAVRGRVVIAIKAYMNTVPVALRLQRAGKSRAIVFLDEWDGAVLHHRRGIKRLSHLVGNLHHPLEDVYYPGVEKRIREASDVWSTTTFLQKKFGGHVMAMGVDTNRFQPPPADQTNALKNELGLKQYKIIAFGGVVRPHKGIEQILDAMVMLSRPELILLVIGPVTDHLRSLMNRDDYGPLIRVVGAPLRDPDGINASIGRKMPEYLGMADMIVLPLVDNPLAQSQMPIKLFEAMAMAKPIIASAVADLPRVLDGCGWTVPPGDVSKLADAMKHVLDHPEEAQKAGAGARKKCLSHYSRDVSSKQVKEFVTPLLSIS